MAHLRGPDGCPWDQAQDYDSLKPLLLEEAYEVFDAMNAEDFDALEDELGDLLFQVVFYARLAEEEGRFDFDAVAERVHSKLVRRHPHVFGGVRASTPEEALKSWTAAKEAEKRTGENEKAAPAAPSLLDGAATGMPSTLQAYDLGQRAAQVGFDWKTPADVLEKAEEEIQELKQEIMQADDEGRKRAIEEIGDLLFTLANLVRHLGSDPESCLRAANQKFNRRFQALESAAARQGKPIGERSIEDLEQLWQSLKAAEKR
jgi:nucleoside triphosphate diphosphatase